MGLRWWLLLRCFYVVLVHGTVLAGGRRPPERPPRLAGWSPAPLSSWVPTPEPGASGDAEDSAAALAFLQTGDAQILTRANCSQGVAAGAPDPVPPPALRATLRAVPEALAHAANFLNMLFQTNDIREASVAEDVEWYQALVRSLVEGHPWVRRAVLALDAHPLAAKPRLMLQATKGDGEILLQDVSAAAPGLGNLSWDNEWFNALKSQRSPLLRKRVLSNDLRSMDTPKWQRGDSYVGDPAHVRWSPPFLECRDGRFLPAWAVTLSSAFYGLKPDLSPEFKGVVRVDIELRDVAIDQCASGPGWFADTHRCDLNSTQCVPQENHGFVLGRYLCQCKPGFYGASGAASGARAGAAGADGGSRLACRPCHQGCVTCEDDAPCLIQEDRALRAAVLSCQACCMLAVFLSMLVSYHFRRSKRIRASGVILLETILFGSLLLYFPVFILYFKPSVFRCIVLRWVRMLGFAIVYGTITLKLYRVLKLFLSHTAQRVPYVSSGRVLKMLGLILLLVLWFLAAWTIGMLENIDKNIPLVIRTQTARGLHFYICGHDRWDYMMVIAEILFLLWGSFLCYATRAVPSAFHEPRYMGIALHNELMISAAFHVVRFVMVPSLHPDWTLLLFFAHTHGTITMTLALLFIPKFLHAGSPLREEIAAEVYEDELDTRRSGSRLNSSIASAWSEHSLDPDDIREELKKLYAQLEAHKTRRMAANNPHLPKKRGSRRSLGRSIARRVAELPEAVARRSSGGERVGTPAHRGSRAKRLPSAGCTSLRMRDDASWRRTAALRKSRSAEGPARELPGGSPTPGTPREPGPRRKMMAAMASEPSDGKSLDTAPLICKSASAHNLARHRQPPPPRAPPLQKSLTVVAGAREETLLATSRAKREVWHANRHPSALALGHPTGQGPPRAARKPQSLDAADALPPASSSPAKGCFPDNTSPLGTGKVQKRVTYAPIKSISTDNSHLPGRVRVAVRRTPPPPPIRYQSLGQRATLARDSLEPVEPPTGPPARAEEPERAAEGPAEKDSGRTFPPARKGRLLAAASIPAQVCPWELIQEEILSRRQKAAEAADSGTPGEASDTPPNLPSQKSPHRSTGLAVKAFNHCRGKGILKAKRESEGSVGKRGHEQEGGSRTERPRLAEMLAMSLGGIGQVPITKIPEWSREKPGSKPPAWPWQGDAVPCQHNVGTAREATSWGDNRAGQWHSPALGAEEPGALRGDTDAGGVPGPPVGVYKIPPSAGHQEGAETPAVASGGKAPARPWEGAEVPAAQPGKDAPVAMAGLITPEEGAAKLAEGLEGTSRSVCPRDRAEVQQPRVKPVAGSSHPSTAGVQRAAAGKPGAVCPRGAPGVPAGRGALLRQVAVASQEDSRVPPGEENLAKALEKGGGQPEPLGSGGGWGTERVPPMSPSAEVALAAVGKAGRAVGRQAEVCPGETQADSSVKKEICPWEESGGECWGPGRAPGKGGSEGDPCHAGDELGMEKPLAKTPELKGALEKEGGVEDRRAEVCPCETGEGGRTVGAEICPWDAEGAWSEQERGEGERRQLAKGDKSIRPDLLGLLRAQETGSSLEEPSQPAGSASREEPTPKPAPESSELPEVTSRILMSPRALVCPWEARGTESNAEVCPWERGTALSDAGKLDDGKISQVKKGISPQRVAREGTGEMARTVGKGSRQWGSPCPGERAEQPSMGLAAKSPSLPTTPARQERTIDSEKADISPWEVEEESLAKTEICPWEEPAAPLGKGRLNQDTRGTSEGENKPGSRGLQDIKEKLAEVGGCQAEHRDTRIFTEHIKKSLESSKAEFKKPETMESIKEEVCPWESLGIEQLPAKPRAEIPALPKSPSKKSQRAESLKAEVCPQELKSTDKAEICPWEAAASPATKEKSGQDKDALPIASKSPSTGQGRHRKIGESMSGKKEKASSDREFVCPWESLGTEGSSTGYSTRSIELLKATTKKWESMGRAKGNVRPWESLNIEQPPAKPRAGSPVLPKSPSKKYKSAESPKAEVCPWEAQEVEADGKAKICSREAAASPSDQQKAKQGPGVGSKGDKRITRQAALASPERSLEKDSSEQEAVCPWESLGREQPPAKPRAGSPVLPKSPSKKSQSAESLKAEVCPQELKSTDKAEICPWEAAASPSGKEKSRQDRDALPIESEHPSADQGLSKGFGDSMSGKQDKASSDRESICPWESLGTEQPPAKPRAGSPTLPKSPSKKSQSAESLKAEVCPWELKSTDKAEICPWEAAASPSTTEKSRQDRDALPIASEHPSADQGLHKKTGDSMSEKKEQASSDRESICPWEGTGTGTEGSFTGYSTRSIELLKATAKKWQLIRRAKVNVRPWESLGREQPPAKPRAGSPTLPKSPSKKSQSAESLKAEVCPWEAQEVEADGKAKICSREAAASPSDQQKAKQGPGVGSKGDKRITRQAALASPERSLEKDSSEREAVCPWESLGTEQPPAKPRAGSPVLPKSPSKKSQSAESLKAEVCPQELKSTDKAEICPWEAAASPSGKEKSRQDRDALPVESEHPSADQGLCKGFGDSTSGKQDKASSDRESICPWESLGMEQPPEKPRSESPTLPKSPSKKSQSAESLKAEVCPWELKSTDKAEICPWEAAASPSTTEKSRQDRDALPIASENPSADQGLHKKTGDSMSEKKEQASSDRESICPWEGTGTGTEGSFTGYSTRSIELLKATAKKWQLIRRAKVNVRPLESLGTEQPPAKPRAESPTLPKSPSKKSQSAESLKAEVCPWESQEVEADGKAKICSREVAAPLLQKGAAPGKASIPPEKAGASKPPEKGSSECEAICPWESQGMEERSLKSATGKEPSKKSDGMESRKSDICPWEAADPTSLDKETFKPGMHPQDADRASPTGTGKSKPVAGASSVSATALLKKPKSRSDCKAEHKPLCRILPGIEPPRGPGVELLPQGASTAPTEGSSPSTSATAAEVCPREAEETLAASDKPSPDMRKTSKVCPWEVESVDPSPALHGEGKAVVSPQDGDRGVRETEPDVCPWEHE